MSVLVLALVMLPAMVIADQGHTQGKMQAEVNPIGKVVGMLEDMQKELEAEAKAEKDVFDEALCMCDAGKKKLGQAIDHSNSEIERLTAKVESLAAEKAKTSAMLGTHEKDKADGTKSLAEQTALREKDHGAFVEAEQFNKANIASLDKAIPLFGEGAAFLQRQESAPTASSIKAILMRTKLLDLDRRQTLLAFLDATEDGSDAAPSAPVAEIVGILKSMRDEMAQDLADITKTETTERNAFLDMKESKTGLIHSLGEQIIEKTKREGEIALSLSQSRDALEDAEVENSDATKYLSALTAECDTKAADMAQRSLMRTNELSAISQALEILSEDEATDTFKKALPSAALLTTQRKSFDALLQVKSKGESAKQLLLAHNKKQSAKKAASHEDPPPEYDDTWVAEGQTDHEHHKHNAAEKVVHFMIDNMVEVLHDDDVNDEHKKAFCINETATFTQLQGDKEALDAQLTESVEKAADDLEVLTADIKALSDELFETDQNVAKATALRKDEHQGFIESFNAMDTATRLIDRAAVKLQEFYSPEMMAKKRKAVADKAVTEAGLALVQRHSATSGEHKVDPVVIPDTPKTYVKKEGGSIVAVMDMLKQEIAADQKEAEVNEKHAAHDYTETMKEAKASRAALVKMLTTKKATSAEIAEKKFQEEAQLKLTKEELVTIAEYLRQLDIECTYLMKNYEWKHEARVSEEMGLENAEAEVTHVDPMTHHDVEDRFEEEHSQDQVDQHFPDVPLKAVFKGTGLAPK